MNHAEHEGAIRHARRPSDLLSMRTTHRPRPTPRYVKAITRYFAVNIGVNPSNEFGIFNKLFLVHRTEQLRVLYVQGSRTFCMAACSTRPACTRR